MSGLTLNGLTSESTLHEPDTPTQNVKSPILNFMYTITFVINLQGSFILHGFIDRTCAQKFPDVVQVL